MTDYFGSDDDDVLIGGPDSDNFFGYLGNNTLRGGGGGDFYYLGDGADTIEDGNGTLDTVVFSHATVLDWVNNIFTGDVANDFFQPSDIDQYIGTANGNDVIRVPVNYANGVILIGGNGTGNDSLAGGAGADVLFGGRGNDVVEGNSGADYLYGDDGVDILLGGAGDDFINPGFGNDIINGGTGADTARFELFGTFGDGLSPGWTFDAVAGTARVVIPTGPFTIRIETDTFSLIETITSESGGLNDVFYGNGTTNFDGGEFGSYPVAAPIDVDTLVVAASVRDASSPTGQSDSPDRVDLGAGTVTRSGTYKLGFLTIPFTEISRFKNVEVFKTGVGNDVVTGSINNRAGFDELRQVETYNTKSTIYLGAGNDTGSFGTGNETAYGEDGNDSLSGGAGSDTLDGGNGNDALTGGLGNDNLRGGSGTDSAVFSDHLGYLVTGWTIDLAAGKATTLQFFNKTTGVRTYETDTFTGVEKVYGSTIGDTIAGSLAGTGTQVFLGAGNDKATMGANNDTVFGEAGIDTINGGIGNDQIVGGVGADILTGGVGIDKFFYVSTTDGTDLISDFAVDDFFAFKGTVFGALPVGALAATRFWTNATGVAHDADDRFIFNTTDDTLWYDSNGTAAGGAFKMADMNIAFNLTAADVLVV